MEHLLKSLNAAQRDAVSAPRGNFLILAGAGSGKTRVLVHRIAWLIEPEQISPHAILAVTFTNKAANEMRGRIEALVGGVARGMWVGTFHGLAHRLLRLHWREAKLPEAFQILDSEDQHRLVRRVMKNLEIDEDRWPPKQVQWFINAKKDEGLRPHQVPESRDLFQQTLLRIYQSYEETCLRGGLVDFAELLLRSLEVLRDNKSLLEHYQNRFQEILVDEFQDTNAIQYAWLSLIAGKKSHVMIVGDDDQSIYSWRGAKVENIRRFQKEFPDTRTIVLEQNYRSTGNILRAANSLITNNDDRLGKNLWTEVGEGEPISIYSAFNELDEARFIVETIKNWINQGNLRRESAILYRSNAQSRVLEEALIQAGIPYRVYGGMRFFERAEIKDALAYLRLISNPHDDPAFERVVNLPARGIGERSLQAVRDLARQNGVSLWRAAEQVVLKQLLTTRGCTALQAFLDLVKTLEESTVSLSLSEMTEHVIEHSGLLEHYRQMKGEKGQAKVENLGELVSATREFVPDEEHEDLTPLTAFLSHAALEAGEGQAGASEDCVQLMTLHSAKGLEFPLVFIAGVEEGLFPHQMSLEEPGRLEEERRLCYVGITRAMQQLYLCHAETRRMYGKELFHPPSRFILELPQVCLQEVRARGTISRPTGYNKNYQQRQNSAVKKHYVFDAAPTSLNGLTMGQHVKHAKFGEGIIINFEGKGDQARVQVQFAREGTKWLMLAYAKLEPA
ncbi:MAG: DNA helicase II [Legionellaceae bacterium]|mgnify:CR=1 FL=1|nr:DNA helicase II [Legionellaceae bacterium]|tara:strand:+ start:273 stop:2471 length:2199 start_codon:yes stop_codon:yes gene_type:complete